MQIREEVYLDYADVLILPKRSTLTSRNDVTLTRNFTFINSKQAGTTRPQTWVGIPIVAANMDCVGTISMAFRLEEATMLTCLSKYYQEPEEDEIGIEYLNPNHFAHSYGIMDVSALCETYKHYPSSFICLDVANGYTERFVQFVADVRARLPSVIIIAGNVATPEMTEALILAGADIVKVGIGPGAACWVSGTKVQTNVGKRGIENIHIGDMVLTHKGNYKQVTETHSRIETGRIYTINGERCTEKHEFYVLNKKYKDIVNDENIHKYAQWVSAQELSEEWFLIKPFPNTQT